MRAKVLLGRHHSICCDSRYNALEKWPNSEGIMDAVMPTYRSFQVNHINPLETKSAVPTEANDWLHL
jgi:hypothetical protein